MEPKSWERHGLKHLLHHNVLAIALANKLARIAWSVLARGRASGADSEEKHEPAGDIDTASDIDTA
jgi:hypothetical protein